MQEINLISKRTILDTPYGTTDDKQYYIGDKICILTRKGGLRIGYITSINKNSINIHFQDYDVLTYFSDIADIIPYPSVIYRPNKGSLAESVHQSKRFNNIEEMSDYIVTDWDNLFTVEDIVIGENDGEDTRIGWKETRHVCTKRIGNKTYDTPQCIGFCCTLEN